MRYKSHWYIWRDTFNDWRGTFVINGAERVVVSQLHRSPGVSFNKEINIQTGKDLFSGKIIPYKGTWLEFETDKNDFLSVKIDRKKKVLATVFLKAIDFFENNTEIKDYFLETKELELTPIFQKYKNREELVSVLRTNLKEVSSKKISMMKKLER